MEYILSFDIAKGKSVYCFIDETKNIIIEPASINHNKKEFDVLRYLAGKPGQVVTREMLLREVWDYKEYEGGIRTIDVTMNRIRDKIEQDKADPKILITKRGIGYYINDPSKV